MSVYAQVAPGDLRPVDVAVLHSRGAPDAGVCGEAH